MRMLLIAVALGIGTGAALADDNASPFDDAAKGAQYVRKLDRMVWALTATCEQGDDVARRQCRILRDVAAGKIRGTTLLVDVTAGAVEIGAWDSAGKATPITIRGCAACEGIEVDGTTWFVVTNKASPTVTHGKVEAAALTETIRLFPNDALATGWKTTAGPRLRTQLLMKVPTDEKKAVWSKDGQHGLAVEIVGFRVWDQCDGTIVAANPESAPGPIDRKTCGAVDTGKKGDKVIAEPVYAELSKDQILATLRPAVEEAQACHDKFGVTGNAKVKVTIGGDGSVIAVNQTGDFVGTDTGKCIDAAIKKATFPRSKKAKTTISYPISVQ